MFEHDAVLTVLAGGDFDVMLEKSITDGSMTEDIIRGCWLFDEKRFEVGELGKVRLCFGNGPDL